MMPGALGRGGGDAGERGLSVFYGEKGHGNIIDPQPTNTVGGFHALRQAEDRMQAPRAWGLAFPRGG